MGDYQLLPQINAEPTDLRSYEKSDAENAPTTGKHLPRGTQVIPKHNITDYEVTASLTKKMRKNTFRSMRWPRIRQLSESFKYSENFDYTLPHPPWRSCHSGFKGPCPVCDVLLMLFVGGGVLSLGGSAVHWHSGSPPVWMLAPPPPTRVVSPRVCSSHPGVSGDVGLWAVVCDWQVWTAVGPLQMVVRALWTVMRRPRSLISRAEDLSLWVCGL